VDAQCHLYFDRFVFAAPSVNGLTNVLSGIGLIVAIIAVAGFVAYIGDRVGHQVGRRRLTLFGLRPKYTSTIVAVGTGMVIALAVTMIALLVSNEVRTAFFRLNQINTQIKSLEAQALAQSQEIDRARNFSLAVPVNQMIAGIALTLHLDSSENEQLQQLSAFFDQSVTLINEKYARSPYDLKPYLKHASDPEVQAGLRKELEGIRNNAIGKEGTTKANDVLVMPVAGVNLVRGDQITFKFASYLDVRLARAGEVLATQVIEGGSPLNLSPLVQNATVELARRGMPPPFLANPSVNAPQVQSLISQLSGLRGKYEVAAKSSFDLFPHSGTVVFDFSLSPAR
jgi:hypothetical protein